MKKIDKEKFYKKTAILLTFVSVCLTVMTLFLANQAGYINRILVKMGGFYQAY